MTRSPYNIEVCHLMLPQLSCDFNFRKNSSSKNVNTFDTNHVKWDVETPCVAKKCSCMKRFARNFFVSLNENEHRHEKLFSASIENSIVE